MTEIGTLYVHRSIFIDAPSARVWEHFETRHQLAAWFSRGHTLEEFEPGPTGRIELSVDVDGNRRSFGGLITVWQPEQELSFANNWQPPHAWPVPTQITFRLTALYDGTRVELFHHGFERLGARAADEHEGYEGAWDLRHLRELKRLMQSGS